MRRKKTILLTGLVGFSLFLHSCGAYTSVKTPPANLGNLKEKALQETPREAGVVQIYLDEDVFTIEDSLKELPNKNKYVRVVLNDVPFEIALHKISEVIGFNIISDIGQQQRKVNINFQGSLYDFLKALENSLNLVVEYRQNSLVIKDKTSYAFKVSTYSELIKDIEGSLKALGAENIAYDPLTSKLIFTANKTTLEKVEKYLQSLRDNLALVVFNIKVLEVRYNKGSNYGIDWAQLGVAAKLFVNQLIPEISDTPFDPTRFGSGGLARGADKGFSILYANKNYSINGFINLLENHGKVEAIQNLYISTLAGKTGKIEVVIETPFVKSVGTSQVQGGGQVSTIQTDVIKSGFLLEIQPFYDKNSKLLTIKLKTEVNELLNLINLNAGVFGTITQPEVSKKVLENTLKVMAGQTFVIGGLVYDKINKNTSGLPLDTPLTKTLGNRHEKGELVMIVNPVVYEFVKKENKEERVEKIEESKPMPQQNNDNKIIDNQNKDTKIEEPIKRRKGISIKEE